ncbi:MAG TPA: hypothetical protein VF980_21095 [Thermoanaerobaculia bacterium]
MRLAVAAAMLWTTATIVMLIVISVLAAIQPRFPLNLGMIRTTGRAGLFVTLLPVAIGVAGMALYFTSARTRGAALLVGYSTLWASVMLSGLPAVWNARRSFCLKGLNFCIISPWVARLTVFAIALPFLAAAVLFLHAALRGTRPRLTAAAH